MVIPNADGLPDNRTMGGFHRPPYDLTAVAPSRMVPRTFDRLTLPRLAIIGHGRAGKDTMGLWLADNTPLRHGGSTSLYLVHHVVAAKHGITVEEARTPGWAAACHREYDARHANRAEWKRIAHLARDEDVLVFVRQALVAGELAVGLRDVREIDAGRAEGVFDLVAWVHNPRVPDDPTCDFDPSVADVHVHNDDTIEVFYRRIAALCRFARIPMYTTARGG